MKTTRMILLSLVMLCSLVVAVPQVSMKDWSQKPSNTVQENDTLNLKMMALNRPRPDVTLIKLSYES